MTKYDLFLDQAHWRLVTVESLLKMIVSGHNIEQNPMTAAQAVEITQELRELVTDRPCNPL